MINKISFKTKFGWISAYANKNKITRIKFGKTNTTTETMSLNKLKCTLLNFFNGNIIKANFKLQIDGTNIQKKIWNELTKIKVGKTKSYGEIAKKYNLSPRHIGKICGQNKLPLIIPCHRVIKSDKTLGGFSGSGGTNLKKRLLNFEGHKLQS